MPVQSAPNPMTALAAAMLDAALFVRCGDRSTRHSARLMGFHTPAEGLPLVGNGTTSGGGAAPKLARPGTGPRARADAR